MDILNIIKERHSIRRHLDKRIEGEVLEKLQSKIEELNNVSGLNMQLILNEPKAFDSFMAHSFPLSGTVCHLTPNLKKSHRKNRWQAWLQLRWRSKNRRVQSGKRSLN